MTKLRRPVTLQTAFAAYTVDEQIGTGGAGIVYGGTDASNAPVAVKVLSRESASTDKRKRFKNEIAFLAKCTHPNVVQFIEHGYSADAAMPGPFYVMKRYSGSLRDVLTPNLPLAEKVLPLFLQILNGVEAAHLLGAIHRDLKPENVLWHKREDVLAVADFGVASLGPDLAVTHVDTLPGRRLANFAYAAPEQRVPGRQITAAADIFSLGLMLNEMFTGELAHGQGYRSIESVAPQFAYLDGIVAAMLSQSPSGRPVSIAAIKNDIALLSEQEVFRQKISKIDGTVISAGEVDNPLARQAPTLVSAEYRDGFILMQLDRPVNSDWVEVLHYRLGSYASIVPPSEFRFSGRTVQVEAPEHAAQQIVDLFKKWLPQATSVLNALLQQKLNQEKAEREAQLRAERTRAQERLRTNRPLKI